MLNRFAVRLPVPPKNDCRDAEPWLNRSAHLLMDKQVSEVSGATRKPRAPLNFRLNRDAAVTPIARKDMKKTFGMHHLIAISERCRKLNVSLPQVRCQAKILVSKKQ